MLARSNLEIAATTAGPLGKKWEMMPHKLGRSMGKVITNATVASGWLELLDKCDADKCGFEGNKRRVSGSSQGCCNWRIFRGGIIEGVKLQNQEYIQKQGVQGAT